MGIINILAKYSRHGSLVLDFMNYSYVQILTVKERIRLLFQTINHCLMKRNIVSIVLTSMTFQLIQFYQ